MYAHTDIILCSVLELYLRFMRPYAMSRYRGDSPTNCLFVSYDGLSITSVGLWLLYIQACPFATIRNLFICTGLYVTHFFFSVANIHVTTTWIRKLMETEVEQFGTTEQSK
jgi:hypothetical protein